LNSGQSPAQILQLAKTRAKPWSFIFVDGDHEPDGPLWDAQTVANHAARDAIIVFHDLASPIVAEGLAYLRTLGWSCMVLQTMQIMGVAWRGNVKVPAHIPDPHVKWEVPDHLRSFMISGEPLKDYARRSQEFFRDFSSADPYASGRAPLPIGTPTLGAQPSDIRKLRAGVLAGKAAAESLAAELSDARQELHTARHSAAAGPDKAEELLSKADETLLRLDGLGALLSEGSSKSGGLQSMTAAGQVKIDSIETLLAAALSRIEGLSALIADDRSGRDRLQSALDGERRGADALRGVIESERHEAFAMRGQLEAFRGQTSHLEQRLLELELRLSERERVTEQLGDERKSLRHDLAQAETQLKSRRLLLRRLLTKNS
jgi:uncharacterized coiled-coil protein SlyX